MSSNTKTVLLSGVGGQGTILAADLLARAAEESGLDVKVSEIHGMAQRGGAVTTVVRFGDKVQSMIADLGSADCVVSFETTEALRNLPYVKEGGSLFVNDESIKPLPVATGRASMPEHARERLRDAGAMLIPATELARKAGTTKAANVVLLPDGCMESGYRCPRSREVPRCQPRGVQVGRLVFRGISEKECSYERFPDQRLHRKRARPSCPRA